MLLRDAESFLRDETNQSEFTVAPTCVKPTVSVLTPPQESRLFGGLFTAEVVTGDARRGNRDQTGCVV